MAGRRIQVQVFPAFRKEMSVPWLRRVAQQALIEGQPPNGRGASDLPRYRGLSLAIADDSTVRRLNRDYRGLDETTDVLAFAFDHPGHYEGDGPPPAVETPEPFVTTGEDDGFAGEVVVSYPQCIRQAEAQGHPARDELALLIAHGVLHLLGYDHATPEEELVMKARERIALAELGVADVRS